MQNMRRSARHARQNLTEPGRARRVVAELEERKQLLPDQCVVERGGLANGDPLDVEPILVAAREDLVDDQVFGATSRQRVRVRDRKWRRALRGSLLEWHRPEGDIDMDAVTRGEKQRAMAECELAC